MSDPRHDMQDAEDEHAEDEYDTQDEHDAQYEHDAQDEHEAAETQGAEDEHDTQEKPDEREAQDAPDEQDAPRQVVDAPDDDRDEDFGAPLDGGRHERERGTRVVTLELSPERLERLVALGLLDGVEREDGAIAAALKALIDDEPAAVAAPPGDESDLVIPVALDPEEQEFMLESQLLPIYGMADRDGMARVLKKLLAEARGQWLQFNAPRRTSGRAAAPAAPLTADELAEIEEEHFAQRGSRDTPPVRIVPREAQKAYLRSWQSTGRWPAEWGPLPDEPGTVVIDDDVRAIFGLDPL